MTENTASRQDIYSRVTAQIVADLEQGVRPWIKPWNAEHARHPPLRSGRFAVRTRPRAAWVIAGKAATVAAGRSNERIRS
jgi:hypothetical protein